MKHLSEKFFCRIFSFIALLSFAVTAKPQEPRLGIFDPFDRWVGHISLENERARLDNFAVELQQHPDEIGYIVVYAGQTSCEDEAQRQANRMKKYVVEYRGIEWNRVIAKDGGYVNESMVILQPVARNRLSTPLFPYMPATENHVVKKCKQRKSNRKRRFRSYRAA